MSLILKIKEMKMYFRLLLPLMMIGFLIGCQTVTEKEPIVKEIPVIKVETLVLSIPDTLLVENRIPKPPSKKEYIDADWDKKEDLLIKYSRQLDNELKMCIADKQAIKINIDNKVKEHKDAQILK